MGPVGGAESGWWVCASGRGSDPGRRGEGLPAETSRCELGQAGRRAFRFHRKPRSRRRRACPCRHIRSTHAGWSKTHPRIRKRPPAERAFAVVLRRPDEQLAAPRLVGLRHRAVHASRVLSSRSQSVFGERSGRLRSSSSVRYRAARSLSRNVFGDPSRGCPSLSSYTIVTVASPLPARLTRPTR